MRFKQILIVGFLILSVVALGDMATLGVRDFTGLMEFDLVRVEGPRGRQPATPPDYEEQHPLAPQSGVRGVSVEGLAGALEVVPSPTGDVTASYSIQLWGQGNPQRLEQAAAAIAREVNARWVREGDTARLTMGRPAALPGDVQAMRVTVRLAVPQGVDVAVAMTGDADIQGVRGALSLAQSGGQVTVRQVAGPVAIASSLGSVTVEEVEGPANVALNSGSLYMRDIRGTAKGRVQTGALTLVRVAGDVDFGVEQGAARVEDVAGNVKLTASFGETVVDRVGGDVTIDQSFGALRVRGARRAVDVSVSLGELELVLEGAGGWNIEAAVEMGALNTDLPLRRETSNLRTVASGTIGDGAYPVRVEVYQGAARLAHR